MNLQQVNLYQDVLRDKKLKYSAKILLQLCLILIVVFSATVGFKTFQLQEYKTSLTEAQKTQAKLEAEKAIIESSKGKKDIALTKKIEEKTKEIANKQKVLGILSTNEFGNANGFAGYLSGLARQRVEGVWLTHLRVAGGGTDITLKGLTTNAALVPKYLQRLSAEKSFSGMTFQSLAIGRNKDKKQWLDFSLQNISSNRGSD